MTGFPSPAEASAATHLDLYWIPLGVDTPAVEISGRIYEACHAVVRRAPRCELYHAALVAHGDGAATVVESAPVPDDHGRTRRGVVAEGAVGSALLGRFRVFRYEVRRWNGGVIPDLQHAVASPVRVADDTGAVHCVLAGLEAVPTLVWGRDPFHTGDMWNSNSVISWALARGGLVERAGSPPPGGRAPGWDAGVRLAQRGGDDDRQPVVAPVVGRVRALRGWRLSTKPRYSG